MCSTLSWVGSLVDSDYVLWLSLLKLGMEGGWEFNFPFCSIIFPYQGILSKKNPTKKCYFDHNWGGKGGRPHCGGHHPKVQLFFDAAPNASLSSSALAFNWWFITSLLIMILFLVKYDTTRNDLILVIITKSIIHIMFKSVDN